MQIIIKKFQKLENEYFSNKPSSRSYYNPEFLSGGGGLVSTAESIKYEGSVVLNDPNNYYSTSDDVLNVGVTGSPAPGIYIELRPH